MDSSLVNKMDGGAVLCFRLQQILNKFTLVGTCIVMNKVQTSEIGCMFVFLSFFFSFLKPSCSYRTGM